MADVITFNNDSFSGCDMVATLLMPIDDNKNIAYAIGELQTISYSIHMDKGPVRNIGNINVKDYVQGPRTIAGSLVFTVFNKHFANKILKEYGQVVNEGYSFLIDEIPPFDVIISFANEFGNRSKLVIYGIRLVNEGQVMSINDVYTENTYQYVATDIEYLNDDESYTNTTSNNKGLYEITEHSTYSQIGYTAPSVNNTENNENVRLYYKITNPNSRSSKKTVKFTLSKEQSDGAIYITNGTRNWTIGTNEKELSYLLSLKVNDYTAYWSNKYKTSNIVSFSIEENKDDENNSSSKKKTNPIIDYVDDTKISVISNVKTHTKVYYKDSSGNGYSVTLHGQRANISEMTPNTLYTVYTCNDELKDHSKATKVRTLLNGYNAYYDFLVYIQNNSRILQSNNITKYSNVIFKAKELANAEKKDYKIPDSLAKVKTYYSDILKKLKREDFANEVEFQNEYNKYKELLDIAIEIIPISNKLNNNKISVINEYTITEPKLLNDKFTNCELIVSEDTEQVKFYKVYGNSMQFNQIIDKSKFYQKDDYLICKFEQKAGQQYAACAVDSYGNCSGYIRFYIQEETYRAEAIEDEEIETAKNNYLIEKARSTYSGSIDKDLSESYKTRIYTELVKTPVTKTLSTPELTSITNSYIFISINEDDSILPQNYKLVICEFKDTLLSNTKYKISAKQYMTLDRLTYGLKNDIVYSIWIENADEEQVSESLTFLLNSESFSSDMNITGKLYVNKYLDSFEDILNNNNSYQLNSIIDENKNNGLNNKSNILNNVFSTILEERDKIDNFFVILYLFFKNYFINTYDTESNSSDIVAIKNNVINGLANCELTIRDFDKSVNKVTYSSLIHGSKINLSERSAQYTLISFSQNKLNKRYGFILSDNLNKKYMTFNLNVVMEGDNE